MSYTTPFSYFGGQVSGLVYEIITALGDGASRIAVDDSRGVDTCVYMEFEKTGKFRIGRTASMTSITVADTGERVGRHQVSWVIGWNSEQDAKDGLHKIRSEWNV